METRTREADNVVKITEIKRFIVGNAFKNWVFVKVYTDEGLVGLGEATDGLTTMPQYAALEELAGLVKGQNPLEPERLWTYLYKKRYLKSDVSMNGIVLACWDILGKALGVPVWKLLGGRQREKLRAYANGWYTGARNPASYAEAAAAFVERGYTALKFDPFGSAYQTLGRQDERTAQALVRAVRETVGDDIDLCIEAHDRFAPSEAIRIGRWLADFSPMFFEAPVLTRDIEGTEVVARAIPVPVATGEQFHTLREFMDFSKARSIAYAQPEVMNLGLSQALKACAIVEANNQLVACHQAQSPFCTAVNAHLHAVIPNFLIQECFDDTLWPEVFDLLEGIPRVKNGYIEVSDRPGWGVELHEEECVKYPYSPGNFLRLFDDGWEARLGER